MDSVPEGRAANQPFSVTTRPPMAASLPGPWSAATDGNTRRMEASTSAGSSLESTAFWALLAGRRCDGSWAAESASSVIVGLGILAGHRQDLGGQQRPG